MASEEIKNKTSIGSSSLILIFIVLCLATFGLLSLSSARGDWTLAQKNADAVRGYYEADNSGVEFYRMASQKVQKAWSELTTGESFASRMEQELPDYYRADTGMIATEIPMERGQALYIELEAGLDEKDPLSVKTWKVIHTEEYDIDDSLPVWGGEES